MRSRFIFTSLAGFIALFSVLGARAASPVPDACKLLTLEDVQAAFPLTDVKSRGSTLSPIFRGPQYEESCAYVVALPNPRSPGAISKFLDLTVVRWSGMTSATSTSDASFKNLKSNKKKVAAANPDLGLQVSPVVGIGDEAFEVLGRDTVEIFAKRNDLIVRVALDRYSSQSLEIAKSLADQSIDRWQPAQGVSDTTPTFRGKAVEIPNDNRQSATAPGNEWPDACGLLSDEDALEEFPGGRVSEKRAMTGKIRHEGREMQEEKLPHPIGCWYTIGRSKSINGGQNVVTNQVQLTIENVAATPALAVRFYELSDKIGEKKQALHDIGDAASIDPLNKITVRKGRVVFRIRVTGGERDQVLHNEAAEAAKSLARLVASRLP